MPSALNTGAAILNRLIDPEKPDLSREAALSFLKLDFCRTDHVRMSKLSRHAQEGQLTDAERDELNEYLRVADLLAILQSKARKTLRDPSAD
ncbi:MAG TPA: hypothetical protein VL475_04710 [Planctomycetaceae bacterium]|nr:hypothetical protein [Planctomycetaceae bacterium]